MLSPRKTEDKEEKEKQETMPIEEAEHTLKKNEYSQERSMTLPSRGVSHLTMKNKFLMRRGVVQLVQTFQIYLLTELISVDVSMNCMSG